MLAKTLCAAFLLLGLIRAADNGREIPLWPSGAPGSEGKTGKEAIEPPNEQHGYAKLTGVHNPSVTVFLPPEEKATGAAIVVCPGGAHAFLAVDIEGYDVAKFLNSIGVAAFVLKYRLAKEPGSTYTVEGDELHDAQRAMRFVRSRAREWHVDPARVGIMGFSAGGELAALAATRYDSGKPDAADPVERMNSRPDFQVLIYPGGGAGKVEVTKDTPPAFMLCADDDRGPSQTIPNLYLALKQAGVPAEIHIYASGGHGFGIRDNPKPFPSWNTWYLRVGDWMADRGLLKKD